MIVVPRATLARTCRVGAAWLAVCAVLLLIPFSAAQADSDALWNILHNLCVPDEQQHGNPAPCAVVNLSGGEQHGYVLLKDIAGATQFLLMPTAKLRELRVRHSRPGRDELLRDRLAVAHLRRGDRP